MITDDVPVSEIQRGGSRPESARSPLLYTIGHSTHSLDEFVSLLQLFEVEQIVDIRTVPRSRHNPQFEQYALAGSLSEQGLGYVHLKSLGGLRHPRPESPNAGWRVAAFRGFADYMQTEEFAQALEVLILLANERRTAIMCAEALPWRCHRSLVADAVVARGYEVEHIMGRGSTRKHALNPLAVVAGGEVSYPAPSGGSPA